MCSQLSECYVTLSPFDFFQTIPSFWLDFTSVFLNHNLWECLYVCTCVLGKHPELKQISEGTLPWSKQRRIQLTGAYCVTHNPHGSDTVHTAGSRTTDCKALKMFKWISWYFFSFLYVSFRSSWQISSEKKLKLNSKCSHQVWSMQLSAAP